MWLLLVVYVGARGLKPAGFSHLYAGFNHLDHGHGQAGEAKFVIHAGLAFGAFHR